MKLQLLRTNSGIDAPGVLFQVHLKEIKHFFAIAEDEHRDVKVMGETRIPAGTYDIKFRTVVAMLKGTEALCCRIP